MTKTLLKITAIAGLLSLSSLATAEWTVGSGYINLSEDDGVVDLSLGAIYASAGYEYSSGQMTFMPELRLGVGVSDDTIQGVNIEVDTFFSASIRGQYNVTDSFGVFLQPSYSRLEVTGSLNGQSFTDDNWEFGFGGGAAFKLSETASLEAAYESVDGSDVLSVAARFKF
jgi:opacity protein-like surface antigen